MDTTPIERFDSPAQPNSVAGPSAELTYVVAGTPLRASEILRRYGVTPQKMRSRVFDDGVCPTIAAGATAWNPECMDPIERMLTTWREECELLGIPFDFDGEFIGLLPKNPTTTGSRQDSNLYWPSTRPFRRLAAWDLADPQAPPTIRPMHYRPSHDTTAYWLGCAADQPEAVYAVWFNAVVLHFLARRAADLPHAGRRAGRFTFRTGCRLNKTLARALELTSPWRPPYLPNAVSAIPLYPARLPEDLSGLLAGAVQWDIGVVDLHLFIRFCARIRAFCRRTFRVTFFSDSPQHFFKFALVEGSSDADERSMEREDLQRSRQRLERRRRIESLWNRGLQRCTHCNHIKPIQQFARDNHRPRGVANRCKPCQKEMSRDHYARNRDQYADSHARYRENHRTLSDKETA